MFSIFTFCSFTELEGAIITWDFMETIHSRSYTYIIKNLYSQPSDVFDTIIEDEKIEKRSKSVTKTYDELINLGYKWATDQKVDLYELKKKIISCNDNGKYIRRFKILCFICLFVCIW